ncbi:MAG: AMP-binding protein [Bacteroidetes bacterium]|nr:AMP-binding protein [Bacteroidota bacterium]MBK9798659.1 AMP-binding protein [Bacteroidota bacterium]
MNVYSLLEQAAQKWPTNFAIHEDSGSITFSELLEQTEVLRNKLANLKIEKGIGIGIMVQNSSMFIRCLFAGIGCNAVVMPISHQLKKAELDQLIKEAGLHVIIDDYSGIAPDTVLQEIISTVSGNLRVGFTSISQEQSIAPHIADAAFIRFTSGTTGKSKGVIISHKAVWERVEAANAALQLGPSDAVIWVLPMAFHFLVSIVLYIRYGAAIIICKDFLANTILDAGERYKGTLLYASPMHIRLLASDKTERKFTCLKHVISTSTAISSSFCEAFKKRYSIDVSQAYGIIEIGLPIINLQKSTLHPDAVGHALPAYSVEILSTNFEVLPANTLGKLAIKGPGMFDGYLSPPQLKADIVKNGWFLTGDLAIKNEEGLITVKGREKSMINVSGNKVFPEEVEQVLNLHPAIADCKVFGIEHALLGETVKAMVVLHQPESIGVDELADFCRSRLSTYKVPQFIEFTTQLEMTGSGKIKRSS